ncbi:MAG: hypothetical protein ABIQ78_12085 [Dokdonella sp.]
MPFDAFRAALSDLQHDLVERPWLDFSAGKNVALELARTAACSPLPNVPENGVA